MTDATMLNKQIAVLLGYKVDHARHDGELGITGDAYWLADSSGKPVDDNIFFDDPEGAWIVSSPSFADDMNLTVAVCAERGWEFGYVRTDAIKGKPHACTIRVCSSDRSEIDYLDFGTTPQEAAARVLFQTLKEQPA